MSTEVQTAVKVETSIDKTVKRQREARRSVNLGSGGGGLAGGGGGGKRGHKGGGGDDGRHKFHRKRSQSFAGGNALYPPHKKRKKAVALPTKFLLGGNIRDPLNLNSLQDEEVNRAMNAVTPVSSPMPTPQHMKGEIEVIIPADIRDPLSLAGEEDNDKYAASFRTTPMKKHHKKKHKKKKSRSSAGSGKEDNADFKSDESKGDEAIEQDIKKLDEEAKAVDRTSGVGADKEKPEAKERLEPPAKPSVLDLNAKDPLRRASKSGEAGSEKPKQRKLFDGKDRIVSPVVPQPGAWVDRHAPHRFRKQEPRPVQKTPKFKEQNKKFQYGNYHRYYGYRNPGQEVDARLKLLARIDNLFLDKDVLDVGCNDGSVATCIARDLGAKKVVGLDIDRTLIERARSNLRKFSGSQGGAKFPLSMPLVYGTLDVPGLPNTNHFPQNLSFIQGNYVLESDVLLELEKPQFDVILCLSVTKWFQLNWGDAGLKRVFHRMFRQLRPGGKLILEAQSYSSYKKRKNLTETIWRNYQSIKLLPNQFSEFLLSEVGFSKCEVVGSPYHPSKGFQRPIKIFSKCLGSPSSVDDVAAESAAVLPTPGPSLTSGRRTSKETRQESSKLLPDASKEEISPESSKMEVSLESSNTKPSMECSVPSVERTIPNPTDPDPKRSPTLRPSETPTEQSPPTSTNEQ